MGNNSIDQAQVVPYGANGVTDAPPSAKIAQKAQNVITAFAAYSFTRNDRANMNRYYAINAAILEFAQAPADPSWNAGKESSFRSAFVAIANRSSGETARREIANWGGQIENAFSLLRKRVGETQWVSPIHESRTNDSPSIERKRSESPTGTATIPKHVLEPDHLVILGLLGRSASSDDDAVSKYSYRGKEVTLTQSQADRLSDEVIDNGGSDVPRLIAQDHVVSARRNLGQMPLDLIRLAPELTVRNAYSFATKMSHGMFCKLEKVFNFGGFFGKVFGNFAAFVACLPVIAVGVVAGAFVGVFLDIAKVPVQIIAFFKDMVEFWIQTSDVPGCDKTEPCKEEKNSAKNQARPTTAMARTATLSLPMQKTSAGVRTV